MRPRPDTLPVVAASSASATLGPLEQRLGMTHQDDRGIGQPHPPPGPLEQRQPGLALEHRQLLGHGRGRELQGVGHRGDGAARVQLVKQAQAVEVQHS